MVEILTARKHLTDIAEWRKLGEASIFQSDSRLELIEGEIFEMPPIGPNHASHVKRLIQLFSGLVQNRAMISVQDPLQLGEFSEPQPDLMLLRPVADFYREKHPGPSDVLLLIEVADQTLGFDRNQKHDLYAAYNIPEYWIVNLNQGCLEGYREPLNKIYKEKTILFAGDRITLSQLAGITIDLKDIL
ncbi:MAG: Uma2 family endonuclease [Methylococcales bacterium]